MTDTMTDTCDTCGDWIEIHAGEPACKSGCEQPTMTMDTRAQRVDELANEFIETIRRWLSPQECSLADERNRTEDDTIICHTHDFCDANMAMEEAYKNVWGDHLTEDEGIDFANDDVAGEVGAAWMLAKDHGFGHPPTTDEFISLRQLEGVLRHISTDLWRHTVDDPETATVESEEAGMTADRRAIRDIIERVSALADKVEQLINNQQAQDDGEDDTECFDAWLKVEKAEIEEDPSEAILNEHFTPCGLNADWCVAAWHVGTNSPNSTSGDLYVVEEEDIDGPARFFVVQRLYTDDGDEVKQLAGPLTAAGAIMTCEHYTMSDNKKCWCDEPERETRDGGRSVICTICGGDA